MYVGGVMCIAGFLALSHLSNVWLAILGFGVVGGVGAGLVYTTCINMVGKWFPERRGAKTGFVNGGFAYGSLPFIARLLRQPGRPRGATSVPQQQAA